MLKKLHHVAYRCNDAKETVEFYTKMLGLKFAHALSNDRVPSTRMWSPHLHIFFEMADGSYIAFFEVPCSPPAQKDPNTPDWVQHLALEVENEQVLLDAKKRLEDAGIDVVGVTDHGFCHSIYFFDPSGHRLEMTIRRDSKEELEEFAANAQSVLDTWVKRKANGELSAEPAAA
jgi:glyoxylase I family protein